MHWLVAKIREAFACMSFVILSSLTEERLFDAKAGTDPCYLPYFLAQSFEPEGYRIAQYSPGQGLRELLPQEGSVRTMDVKGNTGNPVAVLNHIRGLMMQQEEKWLFLYEYPELLLPPREHGGGGNDSIALLQSLHSLSRDDGALAGPSRLVLITYAGLPHSLLAEASSYEIIEIQPPDANERKELIEILNNKASSNGSALAGLAKDISVDQATSLTKGMTRDSMVRMFRAAKYNDALVDASRIRCQKTKVLENLLQGMAEVIEPAERLEDLAGNPAIKDIISDLAVRFGRGRKDVTQAMLLQGVPGVGKSHTAKVLAGALGLPLIIIRNFRGAYVGQTEENLERLIAVIERLLPAVVFWDEIDQAVGPRSTGPSGDSGVSQRVMARIFEWLGDLSRRGMILFVGATNRPDIIDDAMLDRFGLSIPYLRPGPLEVIEMLQLFAPRLGRKLAKLDQEQMADIFQGVSVSGRDLQEIVRMAGHFADHQKSSFDALIKSQHLAQAVKNHICREDPLMMNFFEVNALLKASGHNVLPWFGTDGPRPDVQPPEWLANLQCVDEGGHLHIEKLHQLRGEMAQQLAANRMMM